MDITFNCDKCGQSLTVDEAGAGAIIDCPKCAAAIMVPNKSTVSPQTRKACPHCGSETVIKASAAYEQGTSTIIGKSSQVGAVLVPDGGGGFDVAPAGGGGAFKGMQQTALAQRLAPPEPPKKKNGGAIIALGGVMALVSLPLLAAKWGDDEMRVIGAVVLVGGIVASIVGAATFESKEKYAVAMARHRASLDYWHKTWYCTTCGTTFRI